MKHRYFVSTVYLNVVFFCLILVFLAVSLRIGYVDLSLREVVHGLLGTASDKTITIVWELRLPRVLLTIAIGAGLGLSGAVLQSLLRNPLAESSVIGVSSSAALGGVIALYFGLSAGFSYALPISAMIGAGIATGVLYFISVRSKSTLTLILIGIAINGFALALISLAMNLSPNPWAVSEIIFWLMGSVRDRSFTEVNLAVPFILLGILILLGLGKSLNALSLGEDGAASLGVNLKRVRLLAIIGTSISVGAGVAVAGTIGFVGLIVPHLIRPLVGNLPSRLLLASALGGAVLLTASDLLVRFISVGPELNLGVVTSLLGTPFFLYIILKTRKGMQ